MPDTLRKFTQPELAGFDRLADSVGFLLRISQIAVYDRFFDELGALDLKPGEFSVLWLIYKNPGVRQGVVARRLSIKNARMTKFVRRVENEGYVMRRVPDDDRRAVELTLSEKGCKFVEQSERAVFDYFSGGASNLSADEMVEFIALLKKFSGIEGGDES